MDVTMKDVAKLAGVSLSTVSRVLNDSSLVREETAKKVEKAVEKLDYQINDSARILRTNTSNLIGVIGAGMERPFLANLLKGIEAEARERGFALIYGDSDGEFEKEQNYLNIMKQKKIDGIILITTNYYNDLLSIVKNYNIPVVFASGYISDPEISCVTVDNVAAAYDMVEFLCQAGHRDIAFIKGPDLDMLASQERLRGVKLALRLSNIKYESARIIEGDFTYESGYSAAQKILNKFPDVTAIFAFNDEMAVGAIRYLKEQGISIPEDISVVGFDGIDLGKYTSPALTTIKQSGYHLGLKSIEILNKIIKKGKIEDNKVFIPHELVVRESTNKLNELTTNQEVIMNNNM
ncbi:MAG: LacI family transcriptional regulator, repressor for deo operon, udp, cdd, tsx, nupC, and nupG [Halanaerobium sp. 4-GBenrich]|jgi:DNA-binding LacI/PurR family transcriptional regulator|uniref:LacI family transcriptional regulator n=1 Tax=Halanaerobium congolense TaxID=54121 RepID=A0A1G6RZL5_9FIRM|nr:LacI family DNA-binding transcriptional regulator [Halanaerobium congolense]KXS50149.1 MAG: LacI family transcriptional regulator, repressor for deo operon, udp, cdd, tsx, nupC, and nupG [Halanaerobium sp. T82-1]ODS50053.1 MAG: LacI family transcriptional regulator, repressor for deo operon, udp, cdd, tsx, nupC, and nupG [Halanaerobium sp. 4-GBenrich]OEG62209.1 MAG: LacI family transcriptional regulator [Halanaerobium sp. MDAL1]PUU90599.1 MAG: LacI family transcriptional regulator, repressor